MSRDNSMMYDLGRVDRMHFAVVNDNFCPVLRRVRCACNAIVTAKQLATHGKCEHCQLTAGLDGNDLGMLRLTLAAVEGINPKTQWGTRNSYCAIETELPTFRRLQTAGLVTESVGHAGMYVFRATRNGCRALRLGSAATNRAMKLTTPGGAAPAGWWVPPMPRTAMATAAI